MNRYNSLAILLLTNKGCLAVDRLRNNEVRRKGLTIALLGLSAVALVVSLANSNGSQQERGLRLFYFDEPTAEDWLTDQTPEALTRLDATIVCSIARTAGGYIRAADFLPEENPGRFYLPEGNSNIRATEYRHDLVNGARDTTLGLITAEQVTVKGNFVTISQDGEHYETYEIGLGQSVTRELGRIGSSHLASYTLRYDGEQVWAEDAHCADSFMQSTNASFDEAFIGR